MRLFKVWLLLGISILLLTGWIFQSANTSRVVLAQTDAQETPTPKPPRTAQITIQYTRYQWWLIRYSNNQIACSFTVEHDGLPLADEIQSLCDPKTYTEWQNSAPCNLAEMKSVSACPGFYLQALSSSGAERKIEVALPLPVVWASITNCNAQDADTHCTTLPNLQLKAEEPLPNESVISVQGTVGGEPFQCMGDTCTLPLKPTGMDGVVVEFWADSSFGDSTEHYTARVRLIPWGEFMNPEKKSTDARKWYVDVLSSQWRDGKLATCSDTWQAFPPIGGLPEWLTSPDESQDLQSDVSYYYLAGSLITHGVVDASTCQDGGLQAPNVGSACGVEAARPKLVEWQNRFNDEILQASSETGVPARLLKNVFARESQIWPGIYTTYKEAGLGQLTENGADTVLLWNPDFFNQFCPLVLDKKYCEKGFGNLDEAEQNMLRGGLVRKVNASCPNCETGIDLSQANFSVRVFAQGMLANCEQVGQVLTNITGVNPGQVSSYDDLWRFTLVNYNAGPGCLANAVQQAWDQNRVLDWASVATNLEPACQGASGYVEDITRMLKATPTPTAWIPIDANAPTPALPRVIVTPTGSPAPFRRTPTPTGIVTELSGQPTPTARSTRTATMTPGGPTVTQASGYPGYPTESLATPTPYP